MNPNDWAPISRSLVMIRPSIIGSEGVELGLLWEEHRLRVKYDVACVRPRQVAILIRCGGSRNAAHLPDPFLEPNFGFIDVPLVDLALNMPCDGTFEFKDPR